MDIQDWIEYLKDEDMSDGTIGVYISRFKKFAEWFQQTNGEQLTPESITPTDLREYKSYLLNVVGYKHGTINLAINTIRSWIKFHDIEIKTPKFLKTEVLAPRGLDRKQENALLRSVERYGNKRDFALIVFILNSGLRVAEVAKSQIEQLELRDRSGVIHVLGKGRKRRDVPLNADARNALKNYIGDRVSGPIFLSQKGGALTNTAIYRVIEKYARFAQIDDVHPHILRHTFAHKLKSSGATLDYVATLLGHENLNTTARYGKPTLTDLQAVVDRISIEES